MKTKISLPVWLVALTLVAIVPASAQNQSSEKSPSATAPAGKLVKVAESDAAWVAKEQQRYPLSACVVSDEKLGSMGDSAQYIYRVSGQPDRLVLLCCDGCEEDFLKSPATYVAKLDDAATKSAKSSDRRGGAAERK